MAVYKFRKLIATTILALYFPIACHCWRASTADAANPLRDFSKLRLEHPRPRPLVSPPSQTTIKSETNSNDYRFGVEEATQDGDMGFKPNSYIIGGSEAGSSSSSSGDNYASPVPMMNSNSNGNTGPFSTQPYEDDLYEQSSTAASNHYHGQNTDDEMTRTDENNGDRGVTGVDHEPSGISDHGDHRGIEHGDGGVDHADHGVGHGDRAVIDMDRGPGVPDDDSKNALGDLNKPLLNAQDDGQQPTEDIYFVPLPPSPNFLAEMEYDSGSDTINEKGMGGIFDGGDQDDAPEPDDNNNNYYGGGQQQGHHQDQDNNENSHEGSNRDRKQYYEGAGYGRFGQGNNGDYYGDY